MFRRRSFRIAVAVFTVLAALAVVRVVTKAEDKPEFPPLKSLHAKTTSGRGVDYFESWWDAPGKTRSDVVSAGSHNVQITNGALTASYMTGSQAAIYYPTTPGQLERAKMPAGESAEHKVNRVGKGAAITGQRTIAGRLCDEVKFGEQDHSWMTVCIDRKTGIELAQATYFQGKPVLDTSTKATLFQPNVSISAKTFVPNPPKGMPIVRLPYGASITMLLFYPADNLGLMGLSDTPSVDLKRLSPPSQTTGDFRVILRKDQETDRKRELADLYSPTYITPRFKLLVVAVHNKTITKKSAFTTSYSYDQNAYDAVEAVFIDPKTYDALILTESAKDQKPDPAAKPANGFDGKIITKTSPFPYSILTWHQDGVYFTLGGVNVSESEIVIIARTMLPVRL